MTLEPEERALHEISRYGYNDRPRGGLYLNARQGISCPPARYHHPGTVYERIPWPVMPAKDEGIFSVLSRRASERDAGPPRMDTLAKLLWLSCRVTRSSIIQTPGGAFEAVHHPYPEGGAAGALEIWPLVYRAEGYPGTRPGLYHYDAWSHRLGLVSEWTQDCYGIRKSAQDATGGQASPDVVLVITCRFGRYRWKYAGIAYRVALMATGCLYQSLYLAATALGMSPCGTGSGDSVRFSRLAGLDDQHHSAIGEFIIGGVPQ